MAHKIEPKVGDELIEPARRYTSVRRHRVVAVRRLLFDTVPADRYDDYLASERDGVRTYPVTTWRKDSAREQGWTSFDGPRIYTPEQWAEIGRREDARDYLNSIGVETYRLKGDVISVLDLANLVRRHLGEKEI